MFFRDNDVGFDAAHVSRLFAPFERLHPDREFEGSGLGLTIVKSAIEKNRGRGLGRVVHRYGRDLLFRTAQLLGARIRVNSGCTVPGTYEQWQLSSVRR